MFASEKVLTEKINFISDDANKLKPQIDMLRTKNYQEQSIPTTESETTIFSSTPSIFDVEEKSATPPKTLTGTFLEVGKSKTTSLYYRSPFCHLVGTASSIGDSEKCQSSSKEKFLEKNDKEPIISSETQPKQSFPFSVTDAVQKSSHVWDGLPSLRDGDLQNKMPSPFAFDDGCIHPSYLIDPESGICECGASVRVCMIRDTGGLSAHHHVFLGSGIRKKDKLKQAPCVDFSSMMVQDVDDPAMFQQHQIGKKPGTNPRKRAATISKNQKRRGDSISKYGASASFLPSRVGRPRKIEIVDTLTSPSVCPVRPRGRPRKTVLPQPLSGADCHENVTTLSQTPLSSSSIKSTTMPQKMRTIKHRKNTSSTIVFSPLEPCRFKFLNFNYNPIFSEPLATRSIVKECMIHAHYLNCFDEVVTITIQNGDEESSESIFSEKWLCHSTLLSQNLENIAPKKLAEIVLKNNSSFFIKTHNNNFKNSLLILVLSIHLYLSHLAHLDFLSTTPSDLDLAIRECPKQIQKNLSIRIGDIFESWRIIHKARSLAFFLFSEIGQEKFILGDSS